MELVNMTIRREGIGAKLAKGIKALPEALGTETGVVDKLRDRILDVKGEGVIMHDHRQFWSVFFGEIVAHSGPSIQGTGTDANARPELGYNETTPGVANNLEEALVKVKPVRETQLAKLWNDTLGICMFGMRGVDKSIDLSAKCLAQAVGWEDFTTEEALEVGERVTNLMRMVYARRGFTKADEFDISAKHLEPPNAGPSKDMSIEPYLPAMVDEYYRQMDWNVETGLPTKDTLKRLGMTEFLDDMAIR
jgi:aldehyde:ferredoxin oxidoreductase